MRYFLTFSTPTYFSTNCYLDPTWRTLLKLFSPRLQPTCCRISRHFSCYPLLTVPLIVILSITFRAHSLLSLSLLLFFGVSLTVLIPSWYLTLLSWVPEPYIQISLLDMSFWHITFNISLPNAVMHTFEKQNKLKNKLFSSLHVTINLSTSCQSNKSTLDCPLSLL